MRNRRVNTQSDGLFFSVEKCSTGCSCKEPSKKQVFCVAVLPRLGLNSCIEDAKFPLPSAVNFLFEIFLQLLDYLQDCASLRTEHFPSFVPSCSTCARSLGLTNISDLELDRHFKNDPSTAHERNTVQPPNTYGQLALGEEGFVLCERDARCLSVSRMDMLDDASSPTTARVIAKKRHKTGCASSTFPC